jgi:hypothetical protein
MWLDLPFDRVPRSVEQNVHTTFSFPNPLSKSEKLTASGIFKISAIILEAIRRSFLTKSATATRFTSVRVAFGRPLLSSSSNSSLPARNRKYHLKTFRRFRDSSHKPFAPILKFLSQTHQCWNKISWQLSVHFHLAWRRKKIDFARQVITRTLSKINERNSVCEWMLVDST